MTKLFTKTELKHLKYKLINEKGMSAKEAHKHIKKLIKETEKSHNKILGEVKKVRKLEKEKKISLKDYENLINQ